LAACLDQVRPEGVWITTPQFTHRALFETCLSREVSVFCEKPLAHSLADARAMADLAARHPNVTVAVGFMLAHNPLFARAADLVRSGVLGAPKSFKASCRLSQVFSPKKGWTFTREQAGGGVLINSGVHLLNLVLMVLGRPAGVFVRGQGVHNEVEDTLWAIFDYPSGLFGSVEVSWSVPGYDMQTHDLEVTGTEGVIEVGNQRLRLWLARTSHQFPAGWTEWSRETEAPRAAFSLSPEYCGDEFFLEDFDFIEAVRKGRPPRAGMREALEVQELLDAMYRSMTEKTYIPFSASASP
jgi:predicted dehydrogenase